MNKKQEAEFMQNLNSAMHRLSVKSVGDGFKACAREIKDKIEKGDSLEDVIKYCDWALGNNDTIVKVVNKDE